MSSTSSQPLTAEEREEGYEQARETLLAQVEEGIRARIFHAARVLSILPEGVPGHVEMAFKIVRKDLVIKQLREVADTLEKGYDR